MDLSRIFGEMGWVAKDGRPAKGIPFQGLAAYESGNRKYVVLESLIAWMYYGGDLAFIPRSYSRVCRESPGGFVSPHPRVASRLKWRPCIYQVGGGGIEGAGSQRELNWRHSLARFYQAAAQAPPENEEQATKLVENEIRRVEESALKILRALLSPQQRLELAAEDKFRVRGGETGNLYQIELGDGFRLLTKRKNEVVQSFCLHTEYWLPDGDIALATKLALENPELEIECLLNAGGGGWPLFAKLYGRYRRALSILTQLETIQLQAADPQVVRQQKARRYAADIEKELIL